MAEQAKAPRARREGTDTDLPADAPGPGSDEVQANFDEMNAKGYLGVEADPTPDANYTVAGQLAGKPTPETDRDHRREVAGKLDEQSRRF